MGYLYNIYYPEDLAKEPIGIVFYKDKFHQFFHSTTIGNPYLGMAIKEANQYKFQDDTSTEEEEQKSREQKRDSLYRSITQWSKLIKDNQEAPKDLENLGPQIECPPSTPPQPPSLLPHILLSRHNRDYQWP